MACGASCGELHLACAESFLSLSAVEAHLMNTLCGVLAVEAALQQSHTHTKLMLPAETQFSEVTLCHISDLIKPKAAPGCFNCQNASVLAR